MKRIILFSLAAVAAAGLSQPLSARDHDIGTSASVSVPGTGRTVHSSAGVSTSGRMSAGVTTQSIQPRTRTYSSGAAVTGQTTTRMAEPRTRTTINRGTTIDQSPSVAFGGSRVVRDRSDVRGFRSGARISGPSFDVYRNWDRDRVYSWDNRRWRWYGNDWVIADDVPEITTSTVYSSDVDPGLSLAASVQSRLDDRGYHAGPADGVIGPQTRDAIADFQADHGLPVTGRIDTRLLRALDL